MIGDYEIQHKVSSVRSKELQRFVKTHPVFIETGSNIGAGIQEALDAGFRTVHSIEGLAVFYQICAKRFQGNSHVQLYYGYSPLMLGSILLRLREPAVIYLDAHSIAHNPLIDELLVIRQVNSYKHVIMIDDVRMFDTPDWHGIKRSEAMALLMEIHPGYTISYLDTVNARGDLLVAC